MLCLEENPTYQHNSKCIYTCCFADPGKPLAEECPLHDKE